MGLKPEIVSVAISMLKHGFLMQSDEEVYNAVTDIVNTINEGYNRLEKPSLYSE